MGVEQVGLQLVFDTSVDLRDEWCCVVFKRALPLLKARTLVANETGPQAARGGR